MEYAIKISAADIVIIGDALDGLPYKRVAVLVRKIQQQITEQEVREKARLEAEARQTITKEVDRLVALTREPIKPKSRRKGT